MITVNIHEAKTNLSRLLQRVEKGERVVIARAGKPVATLGPLEPDEQKERKPGAWEGRGKIAPDFDELPDEIMAYFDGRKD